MTSSATISIAKLNGNTITYDLNDYKYIVYNTAKSQITGEDVLWFGASNTKHFTLRQITSRQITSTKAEINLTIIENHLKDHPEKHVKFDGCCFKFPE